jgi:hypothetical protein
MLIFTPFALCFVTLRGIFYAISRTNLLTRCHSASFLFSAVFVFQKSYTGNILGIGRNKFQKSYFSWKSTEDRKRARGGPEAAHTRRGRGPAPGRADLLLGRPGSPLTTPLRLYKASRQKILGGSAKFPEQFRSAAAVEGKFRGTEVSVPVMSTHTSVLVDSVGPPSAEVCRAAASSLKWITQGLLNSGRKRSKLSLSSNPAITIQKVSYVPNTPNTLIRCIGALVWRRDSEIQVVWMIISSKCNMK